ncbi:MAG TPA: arsenate reductase ArsC [Acidimicrobiales bacterium]|nr:arsenate reductase ArsC [Acidimicrobiales bacterium]MDP6280669.1 arsenate reductase ArsC [Acidimicrobiales bacterium]MDP7118142.1 arsenate reductase ArsC [Acidimicrobiales bacterium]MDP7411357.1 arsenate reductase ArsC [Acidimicrobiales bacterium]MEE1522482.1 arsenate reductase ArsC [Acidimicrobiales bacterium]
MNDTPGVLFLCIHNAGRSQMAAGWLHHLGGGSVRVHSAGSEPAESVYPVAVEAMGEVGIDISGAEPNRWTEEMLADVDLIVSMGCGDICPIYPGKRCLDWPISDPAGQGLSMVRGVRDEIRVRVVGLLAEMGIGLAD